jgi:hypothetical protein
MLTLLAIAAGALTIFGLLALGHEYARARKNFEATTTNRSNSEASTWSRGGESFQVVASAASSQATVALHSITSSAAVSSVGGTVRPSIRAVWALMTSSNFVACKTGSSAGLAPLRMRPV